MMRTLSGLEYGPAGRLQRMAKELDAIDEKKGWRKGRWARWAERMEAWLIEQDYHHAIHANTIPITDEGLVVGLHCGRCGDLAGAPVEPGREREEEALVRLPMGYE